MSNAEQQQTDLCLKTLGIETGNKWSDIEKQYRTLVQTWHPDRYSGNDNAYAQDRFIEINAAFNLLRENYRKTGTIPSFSTARPILQRNTGSCDVPADMHFSSNSANTIANKNHILKVAALFAGITLLVTLFWVLDNRVTENNRERALILKTTDTSTSNPTSLEAIQQKGSDALPIELISANSSK